MTELTHGSVRRIADKLNVLPDNVSAALAAEGIATKRPPSNVERLNELYMEWSSTSRGSIGEYFAQQGVKAVREEA